MLRKNIVIILLVVSTALLLTACGGSAEKKIIGSWEATVDGESEGTFWEFVDDRLIVSTLSDDESMMVEYLLIERENDDFMIDVIDPDNGDREVIFEGYFENKKTIKPVEGSEELEGELQLVKVKNIDKAIDKARAEAEAEAEEE